MRLACIIMLTLITIAATGCDRLGLSTPKASVTGVKLQEFGLTSATLAFDVCIENPYSVPLPLVNLDFSLASGSQPFLSGQVQAQGTVPAKSSKTVVVPARLAYIELIKTLKSARPGAVVPYAAEIGASVDAPLIGRQRLAARKDGKLPIPTVPDVELTQVKWQSLSLDEAGGVVQLRIANRNDFPMDLSKLGYSLSLGGVQVGKSSISRSTHFDAGSGAATVDIPISFSPKQAGLAFMRVLTGKGSGYALTGELEVSTPFGPLRLPLDKTGQTVFTR